MHRKENDCDVSITFELSGVSPGAIVTVEPPHCMPSASTDQIAAEILKQLKKKYPPKKCDPPVECRPTGEKTVDHYEFTYEPFTLSQNGSEGTCVSHVHGSCRVEQTTVHGTCRIDL